MKKFDLFRKLYKYHTEGNAWLDTVPRQISTAIFDNPYVNALRTQLDAIQAAMFTEEQLSDIDWFLFDWSYNRDLYITFNNVEYRFLDIEEYIQFLQEHCSEVWGEESHPKPELVEYPKGTRAWYLYGKLHRTDGPAIEYVDGICEWWIKGEEYSFDYWCRRTNKTEEEIAKLKEQYLGVN